MWRSRKLPWPARAGGVLLAALLAAGPTRAGTKDPDVIAAIADAYNDHGDKKHDAAMKKLAVVVTTCTPPEACSPNTRAQTSIATGIVQGAGLKDEAAALAWFEKALSEDPNIVPDPQFMTPELTKLFHEAQKSGPAHPRKPATMSQAELATVAVAQAQLAQNNWPTCMATIIAALAQRGFAAGELILARCEDAGGLLLEAAAHAKLAIDHAIVEENAAVENDARDLVKRIENETPTITVVIPRSVDEPVLFVDGVIVPKEKASSQIPHNPGKAAIEVKGKGTCPFVFKSPVSLDRGDHATVDMTPEIRDANRSQVQCCISLARTPEDVETCIASRGKRGLTPRGGLEVASYNDNVSVDVLSPTLFFSLEHPTAGWRVGGSYTVDVVTNASPDIVATATRRFNEVRHAGALAAELKIGRARVGLDGGVSIEPDYFARNVGASISADLVNKQVTPTLAYHLSFDTLGRAHTPYDIFSRSILTHSIDAGVSVVKSPTTILIFGASAELDSGDTSKPYRHIPMFSAGVAARIPRGASPALVNGVRLAPAPFEQLPDARNRFAVLGRFAHRLDASTLRADERLYADTWGLKASTTDAHYLVDITKTLRVGPHARFHVQGPVDFWERAYVGASTSSGWKLPNFRAGDRELGPLFALTLGGKVRYALSEIFAVSLQAEGIYTQFLDTIYVYDRWSLFTATTLEIGIE
jgi:hypothetical protein